MSGKIQYKKGGMYVPQYLKGRSNIIPIIPEPIVPSITSVPPYTEYDPIAFFAGDNLRIKPKTDRYSQQHRQDTFKNLVKNINETDGQTFSDILNPTNIKIIHDYNTKNYPNTITELYKDGTLAPNNTAPNNYLSTYNDGYYIQDRFLRQNKQFNTQKELDDWKLVNPGMEKDKGAYLLNDRSKGPIVYKPNLLVNNQTTTTTPVEQSILKDDLNKGKGADAGKLGQTYTNIDYTLPYSTLQKLNLLKGLKDAADVKTYYPIRQHQESILAKASLIDDQSLKNNINQSYFNTSKLNQGTINPSAYLAANKELAGQRLDKNNEIIGNILNQNNQITNGEKQAFAQTSFTGSPVEVFIASFNPFIKSVSAALSPLSCIFLIASFDIFGLSLVVIPSNPTTG